jgi:hypothetical protein
VKLESIDDFMQGLSIVLVGGFLPWEVISLINWAWAL